MCKLFKRFAKGFFAVAMAASLVFTAVTPAMAKNKNDVKITFAGDILFAEGYAPYYAYLNRGSNITKCIEPEIIKKMKAADIMMLNNEFTYSKRGKPTANKKFTFRAKPEMAKNLNKMGVDVVSLANNHAYDWGEVSLLDTMDTLKKNNILYQGAGKNIKEASKPLYITKNGVKTAIVCATQIERTPYPDTKLATKTKPGVMGCYNPDLFIKTIKEASKNSDFTVVYVHWGTEGTSRVDKSQRDLAKKFVDAGADLIIGNHPHVLQGFEYIKGVPVIYSLGNFWFNSSTRDTGMLTVRYDKKGIKKIKFIPCIQKNLKTTLLKDKEKTRLINYMNSISFNGKLNKSGNLYLKK